MKRNLIKKISGLDKLILFLILGITFLDTINGPLITKEIISISKPYKFLILLLMVLRMALALKVNRTQLLIIISFSSFFIGYFITLILNRDITLFALNFIESIKYFIWPISFVYFTKLYSDHPKISSFIFKIVLISYLVIVTNIFLGLLGFGYQFYPNYDTGVKGFFYSGNEFSLLFILLTFCISWKTYQLGSYKYYLFMIFSLFLAFKIGSKTTIIGVAGIFLIILVSNIKISLSKIRPKRFFLYLMLIFILPIVGWIFVMANKTYFDNFIFKRIEIYEFDLVTWVLSKRNLVAQEGFEVFGKLSTGAKFFGQGEETFQRGFDIVEIDFLDLLFNHGFFGLFLFLLVILKIFREIFRSAKGNNFKIGLVYFYVLIVFFLANLSGHIINTGVPGFFLGMIFAMCHSKNSITINPVNHEGDD